VSTSDFPTVVDLANPTSIRTRVVGAVRSLVEAWRQLRLDHQFLITAAIVIAAAMTILGAWVSDRIVRGVVQNSAASTAVFLVGFFEKHVQGLASADELSADTQAKIDELVKTKILGNRILAIKIWTAEGRIAYSSDSEIIGKQFPVTDNLREAWSGSVVPEYNDLSDVENEIEREAGKPMLEIYVPVRERGSQKVVAVAEVYETAEELSSELGRAHVQTILVVATLAVALLASLFHIVRRGSITIEQQQVSLSERVVDLSNLLSVNRELQTRVANANRRAAQTNEQFLRRIGAELHDGPVQLLGLGLLRLDALKKRLIPLEGTGKRDDFEIIRSALDDALREVRGICAGVAIPELQDATLSTVLETAVRNHERRTNSRVEMLLHDSLPKTLSLPINTCLYRFIQEGLNNAFRHAAGKCQKVTATINAGLIELVVSDAGPGIAPAIRPLSDGHSGGLGLQGLKNRIEAIGGEFSVESGPNVGTRLVCRFNIDQLGLQDE